MKIARDIMTKNPFTLKSSMQVDFAVRHMIDHHISTAPVLDNNNQLLGQVSEIMLLKAYIMTSQKGSGHKVLLDFQKQFSKPTVIKETDPIDKVVKNIMESPFHRVLVLDNAGHLQGIISPKDLLRYLVGEDSRAGTMLQEMQMLQDRVSILKDQLQATKSQLSTIDSLVQQSAFMFHSSDAAGKIVIANDRLHQELGYDPKELIGKSVYDLYHTSTKKQVEESLKQMIQSNKGIKMYTTYLKKNGQQLRVEVVSNPIHDAKGAFLATSTISRILDSDSLLRALHGIYEAEEED